MLDANVTVIRSCLLRCCSKQKGSAAWRPERRLNSKFLKTQVISWTTPIFMASIGSALFFAPALASSQRKLRFCLALLVDGGFPFP
jgi:hypothetical protein